MECNKIVVAIKGEIQVLASLVLNKYLNRKNEQDFLQFEICIITFSKTIFSMN